jgi:hypothetical protein
MTVYCINAVVEIPPPRNTSCEANNGTKRQGEPTRARGFGRERQWVVAANRLVCRYVIEIFRQAKHSIARTRRSFADLFRSFLSALHRYCLISVAHRQARHLF